MTVTLQDVLDRFGFIVLMYSDKSDLETDKAQGFAVGETINSAIPNDQLMMIIGEATKADWVAQCKLCGDPVWWPGEKQPIAYLKVITE